MTRVTVTLNKQREAAIAMSGKSVIELIDLGLLAAENEGRQPQAARGTGTSVNCPHPKARRSKGLCMLCGEWAGRL